MSTININETIKYEVVIGVPDDEFRNGKLQSTIDIMKDKWQEYAKKYFDETGIYVSAIAVEGRAIYNKEWDLVCFLVKSCFCRNGKRIV